MKRLRINHLILLVVLLAIVVVLTLPNRFVGVIAKTSSRWLRVEKPNEPTGIGDLTTSPALPDGSLDLTFDTDGRVLIDLGGPFSDSDEIYAVAVQPDGKIVSAGRAFSTAGSLVFALTRHNANGTLDESFGTAGKLKTTYAMSTNSEFKSALLVQPDGKILALPGADREILRFNADGTPDNTFGTAGAALNNGSKLIDMVLQSDGKIVATGGSIGGKFFASRFNTNGSPDSTFGVNGVATTNFSGFARSIVIQTDGRVIVAGQWGNAADFALVRFNVDGTRTRRSDLVGL